MEFLLEAFGGGTGLGGEAGAGLLEFGGELILRGVERRDLRLSFLQRAGGLGFALAGSGLQIVRQLLRAGFGFGGQPGSSLFQFGGELFLCSVEVGNFFVGVLEGLRCLVRFGFHRGSKLSPRLDEFVFELDARQFQRLGLLACFRHLHGERRLSLRGGSQEFLLHLFRGSRGLGLQLGASLFQLGTERFPGRVEAADLALSFLERPSRLRLALAGGRVEFLLEALGGGACFGGEAGAGFLELCGEFFLRRVEGGDFCLGFLQCTGGFLLALAAGGVEFLLEAFGGGTGLGGEAGPGLLEFGGELVFGKAEADKLRLRFLQSANRFRFALARGGRKIALQGGPDFFDLGSRFLFSPFGIGELGFQIELGAAFALKFLRGFALA